MGVMKMGNTLPRVGIEPTSLAFQASVLLLHHVGSLMSPICPCPPVYAAPLPQRPVQTTTILYNIWNAVCGIWYVRVICNFDI